MKLARAAKVAAAIVIGALLGAVAGFFVALVFGQALFGWHDNIGPELRFAFFGAMIGGGSAGAWASSRGDRGKELSHE